MIGKIIKQLLVNGTVGVPESSIFPYVMNENTSFPAIVYTIDSTTPEYTKDGWVGDEISFSVITVSDNYATLQDIVINVRKALEFKDGSFGDTTIKRIYLTGLTEAYNITENAFANKLSFTVEMNSY
jgi:hypothetical protein